MSAERIAELESMLKGVVEANQLQRHAMDAVVHDLERLRTYLEPATSREAIQNAVSGDHVLQHVAADDSTWGHIAPAYKVHEIIEYALRALRGGR